MGDPFVPTTDKQDEDGGGIDTDNISADEYTTNGNTQVRVPWGYEFAPADPDLPRITSQGVVVTKAQAERLVDDSDGLVFIVEKEGDGA